MDTRDLSLAAALITKGHTLEAVFAEEGHAVFRFTATEELQGTVNAFYAHGLQIDAATFGEAIRSAKSAAMAARRQPVATT